MDRDSVAMVSMFAGSVIMRDWPSTRSLYVSAVNMAQSAALSSVSVRLSSNRTGRPACRAARMAFRWSSELTRV